ncbi:AmmeMemoRadiSam system protein A [Candidatus Bipolaricaulota bacterium]|nr:AmmeMemoRadiSam system protein A [Candidatus Bipolaricaulota bacterium]MBS3813870.1 AmmeMemoRadiSam system protein A [Candidatus Bipolaricaulota bacterium]MBS3825435.1 AmmeMemoRadiSam system protein A [Candidatus Bipolaricaulota bacterium]
MEDNYVKLAKKAVRKAVTGDVVEEIQKLKAELPQVSRGVFVTLKKSNHELRGCIGTYTPVTETVGDEILRNASSAALEDPRFPPVKPVELEEITLSVDILTEPETCKAEDLDPDKYGVIVKKGSRSGLLLPDLDGVDSVEEQIDIAKKKAGIPPVDENFVTKRFEVERHEGEKPIGN